MALNDTEQAMMRQISLHTCATAIKAHLASEPTVTSDAPATETGCMRIEADPRRKGFYIVSHHHPSWQGGKYIIGCLQPCEIAELHALLAGWLDMQVGGLG